MVPFDKYFKVLGAMIDLKECRLGGYILVGNTADRTKDFTAMVQALLEANGMTAGEASSLAGRLVLHAPTCRVGPLTLRDDGLSTRT